MEWLLQWWPWIAGGTGAAAAIAAAAWYLRAGARGLLQDSVPDVLPSPPPPPPPDLAEEARQQEERERRRRAEEESARKQRDEQERQRAEARVAEERARREAATRLDALIQQLATAMPFTSKWVQVGMRKTGERAVGLHVDECPYPADDRDVRPMRDVSEFPQLQLSELLGDEDTLLARIAEGTALVDVHLQHTPIMEPVYEPKFEERRILQYILLDGSGSMMESHGI